jgi:hypothetical protein
MDIKSARPVISDTEYDRLKVLYTLAKLVHFINKHAQEDALKAHDDQFRMLLADLKKDLEKHITAIKKIS